MVENDEKLWKMIFQKTFCIMHMRRPCRKKNKKQQNSKWVTSVWVSTSFWGSLPIAGQQTFLSFFFVSLTWASRAHDEKGTFLLIFECFWSVLTMRTHAHACVRWSKYTTCVPTVFKISEVSNVLKAWSPYMGCAIGNHGCCVQHGKRCYCIDLWIIIIMWKVWQGVGKDYIASIVTNYVFGDRNRQQKYFFFLSLYFQNLCC